MLIELANGMASRPFDQKRLEKAGLVVKEKLGEGALIEAAGPGAGIDVASKVVDVVGKPPPPAVMMFFMRLFFAIVKYISSWFGV